MGKQTRNKRTSVGLLFVSRERYLERIWDAAYKDAIDEGLTPEQAQKRADRALKTAKGED